MSNLHVLILAGGSGTRLWPLSREELPKQFLPLVGERTLLQETVLRLVPLASAQSVRVVAGREWQALVRHQVGGILSREADPVIIEPVGRNTGPAIALGLASLRETASAAEDDIVLVCPSDHVIRDRDAFVRSVRIAIDAAEKGALVTFGIVPDGPETGYGYMECGPEEESGGVRPVLRFVEKPSLEAAEAYLKSGRYLWNGGMFCFRLGRMASDLNRHVPEIGALCEAGLGALLDGFESLPSVSIDYAVMEKADDVAAVPLQAGWSDVGSWDAVYRALPADEDGNAVRGNVRLIGGRDNLLYGNHRLIFGVDLHDMLVVDTPDALFVAPRGSSQKVREVVRELKKEGRREVVEAPVNARPWGTYETLGQASRYRIKRIVVEPGARLSLQYHHHRSEHWVVVRGTAQVNLDGSESMLYEGQSCFVPKGTPHRLSNPGKVPLEIIEVQNGEYVGEDDIVRLDDDYRRER
jgi:mannose-1-phosphate guanylyltransferase/mannose-6-phosphate isomerase